MNRKFRWMSFLIVALALLMTFNAVAQSAVTVTTTARVRLREEPSLRGRILATIPFNTSLTAVGVNGSQTWVQVRFNNLTGWVSARYVRVTSGQLSTLPLITTTSSTGGGATAAGTATPGANTAPIITFDVVPVNPIPNTPDAVRPNECVYVTYNASNIAADTRVILSVGTQEATNAAIGERNQFCLTQTTDFTVTVQPSRGAATSRSITIRVVAP